MSDHDAVAVAIAAERARWVSICRSFAENRNPPHKADETYEDGWLDACNEILWAGESGGGQLQDN